MPTRWDAPLTRAVADELEREIGGATLRAIRLDGAERDLFLLFRDRTLVWRLHPTRGEVLLRPPTDPGPWDLPHPARIRRVTAPPDERVVRIELLPRRSGPPRDVVVELMGNQWNALVVEAESGVIRHVLWSRKRGRDLAVGSTYHPPSGPTRAGVGGDLTLDRWLQILSGEAPGRSARTLVREVAWTSPVNAPALLGQDLDAPERERLAAGHGRWRALAEGTPSPVLLELEDGPHPYPVPLAGTVSHPAGGVLTAFDQATTHRDDADHEPSLLDPELVRRLEETVERERRRIDQLHAELESLDDPSTLRATGDLILARYREVPHGAEAAVLVDFDGEEVSVELDPMLEPHANATRYYDRAARVERARERVPELVREAREAAERLEDLLSRARTGEASVEEVTRALPLRDTTKGRPREEGPALPYRTFRSSGGLEIRVGRGAKHNDDLTFRHSAPDDVWLHARHAAGAHVILRWSDPGNPPSRDLAEAATLAALHSRARTSGSVPVDWTRRKYVRKPRGAARGAVVPDRVSTLFVQPDPALERALAE